MSTGRLVGATDIAGESGATSANYNSLQRFQVEATGIITEFKLKAATNGNVKCAIYDDNAGSPNNRLWVQNTGQTIISGWNTIAVSPGLSIVSGTYIWLAVIFDVIQSVNNWSSSLGTYKYKSNNYSNGLPDPAGTGYSNASVTRFYAGWGALVLNPTSINQSIDHGLPELSLSIRPSGITQPLSVGAPAVVTSAAVIYPPGIAQAVGMGTPSLIYPQVISPPGIAQPVAVGGPWVGLLGFIRPVGIEQPVSIGNLTLLKYVWHVILDGRYNTESPDKNRIYIIGRDQYGNPVYGTAVESTELGLVGERLDFQQELAIPTESQAASMASALLSKMRLTGKRGVILIPPNCGQELFDVVQISDSGANQQAVSFRVVGIRFEYNTRVSLYRQQLILMSP